MKLLKFFFLALWMGGVFLFSPASAEIREVTDLLPDAYTDIPRGDTLSLGRLLDKGISVNATNKRGESLLMLAAYEGDLVKMNYLIRAGADLNQRGGLLKSSALDCAVAGRKKAAVDLLLASGVDINGKSPWRVTAAYEAGQNGNYEMFCYLISKGAVLSDGEKINLLICNTSWHNDPEGRRRIMRELLRDMHVEKEDILRNKLIRDEGRKEEICERILTMQDQMAEEKAEMEAERCRQDSLRRLIDNGQADTTRYRYHMMTRIDLDSEEAYSIIEEVPRIDKVENQLGAEATDTFLLLLGLTFLLMYYLSRLAIKNIYKEKPIFFLHALNFVLGSFPLYLIISCLYTNLDDIIIRKFGEEKEARVSAKWVRHQGSRRVGSYHKLEFSFLFVNQDSIRILVDQGSCKFDSEFRQEGISDTTVKVRYEPKSMKLSVSDDKYLKQNLAWILFMCLLGALLFLLCLGKFNKILGKILALFPDKTERSTKENAVFMPTLVSTYWTLSSKRYSSMEKFLEDVRRSEERNNLEAADRMDPDRIVLEAPYARMNLFDQDVKGNNNLCIEISAPGKESFTEGELLFLAHNQMSPYLYKLCRRVVSSIVLFAEPKEGKLAECILIFEDEEDMA